MPCTSLYEGLDMSPCKVGIFWCTGTVLAAHHSWYCKLLTGKGKSLTQCEQLCHLARSPGPNNHHQTAALPKLLALMLILTRTLIISATLDNFRHLLAGKFINGLDELINTAICHNHK